MRVGYVVSEKIVKHGMYIMFYDKDSIEAAMRFLKNNLKHLEYLYRFYRKREIKSGYFSKRVIVDPPLSECAYVLTCYKCTYRVQVLITYIKENFTNNKGARRGKN